MSRKIKRLKTIKQKFVKRKTQKFVEKRKKKNFYKIIDPWCWLQRIFFGCKDFVLTHQIQTAYPKTNRRKFYQRNVRQNNLSGKL